MAAPATFNFSRWGVGCVVVAGFCLAYNLFISPVREHETQLRTAIAEARGQISESRYRGDAIRDLQRKAARAREELQSLDKDLPAGAPIVWIPELVKGHFGQFGFVNSNTTLNSVSDEPGLPDYQRMHWCAAVPTADVTKQARELFAAVAALDQSQPVLHVVDLEIPQEGDEAGKGIAKVHFWMLARK